MDYLKLAEDAADGLREKLEQGAYIPPADVPWVLMALAMLDMAHTLRQILVCFMAEAGCECERNGADE